MTLVLLESGRGAGDDKEPCWDKELVDLCCAGVLGEVEDLSMCLL